VPVMELDAAAVRKDGFIRHTGKEKVRILGPMPKERRGIGKVFDCFERHNGINSPDLIRVQVFRRAVAKGDVGVRIVRLGVQDGLGTGVNRRHMMPGHRQDVRAVAYPTRQI
jgi:hypothetical protein